MEHCLNFAYGSNMLTARLRQRVPSARPLGVAVLRAHELKWHKVANDGSGKCAIEAAADSNSLVYGVVYAILLGEKHRLDRAEGLGFGYEEQTKTVELAGQFVDVQAYVATRIDTVILPYSWYRALVVAGAVEHNLPSAYIDGLRRVPVIQDPDQERHAEHMALAAEA
ncbi:gamma-glutamylcyclotransferase family protein [Cyanobium gracile]|uniref:AIG2-like family protein n=1 Tax=Cyanobium gracile (strain ATCC 27147 / PCC 6307) TaxID=292564 RepID=K9P872_CYAGP|nr:gamma-glutamylcyclotransferase family protein [Cyanobium gracile]AFY29168.1 AIG2-like family protein [Cyanobium gracile PCC 6307]